jgi:excinuclease UvrABC nuclease subunit
MRRRLLRHFKTVDKIGEASPEEISKVGKMPVTLARKIVVSLGKA